MPDRMKDETERYLAIGRGTSVFTEDEIEVLREVLDEAQHDPSTTYHVLEEREEGEPAGFIVFGRTPMTEYAWDLYWIVVEKRFQGRGVGKRLLRKMERLLIEESPRAVIRVETAGRTAYEDTRRFYRRTGFTLLGSIPEFYAPDDALEIYFKVIDRNGSDHGA